MLTHYVKVKLPGQKKSIYLEKAKYFDSKGITFLTGYQVGKQCEPVSQKEVIHLISVGTKSKGPLPLFTPFERRQDIRLRS